MIQFLKYDYSISWFGICTWFLSSDLKWLIHALFIKTISLILEQKSALQENPQKNKLKICWKHVSRCFIMITWKKSMNVSQHFFSASLREKQALLLWKLLKMWGVLRACFVSWYTTRNFDKNVVSLLFKYQKTKFWIQVLFADFCSSIKEMVLIKTAWINLSDEGNQVKIPNQLIRDTESAVSCSTKAVFQSSFDTDHAVLFWNNGK